MIGIRCERGSHRFFKRYGERFEDSEGKRIFLEFADEERQHLELLIREYRALRETPGRAGRAPGARPPRVRPRGADPAVIDLHLHTTASDGRCDAGRRWCARAWQAGLRTIAVTDHDTTAAVADAARAGRGFGIRVVAGIEITAVLDEDATCTCWAISSTRSITSWPPSWRASEQTASSASG